MSQSEDFMVHFLPKMTQTTVFKVKIYFPKNIFNESKTRLPEYTRAIISSRFLARGWNFNSALRIDDLWRVSHVFYSIRMVDVKVHMLVFIRLLHFVRRTFVDVERQKMRGTVCPCTDAI